MRGVRVLTTRHAPSLLGAQRRSPSSLPRRSSRCPVRAAVLGVDLGTSNSAVGVIRDGKPGVLHLDSSGLNYVPSVVAITEVGLEGRPRLERRHRPAPPARSPARPPALPAPKIFPTPPPAPPRSGGSPEKPSSPTRCMQYDETVVGVAAQGAASPDNTFYSFKRLIGRKWVPALAPWDRAAAAQQRGTGSAWRAA